MAPDAGSDDRASRCHRLERGLAEGLDQAWLADDVRGGDESGDQVIRKRTGELDPCSSLELRSERTPADEGQCALAEAFERARKADDVLSLDQRADAEEAQVPVGRGLDPEPLEVDAAVDDLRLAARFGHLRLQFAPEIVRDRDDRGSSPRDEARGRPNAGDRPHIRYVLAVRGHDERRAAGEGRDQARRDEEVRVRDVRAEAACRCDRVTRELEVPPLTARTPVENGPLQVVPARGELL